MKKLTTKVTAGRNGGIHSARAFHSIASMLRDHDFVSPRLYHLCLIDVMETSCHKRSLKMVKRITRHIHAKKLRYRWRACRECDNEKGLHLHVFFFIEDGCLNPDAIFNSSKTGFLYKTCESHGFKFSLNPPRGSIHWSKNGKQKNYALTSTVEKLDDCINWLSYLAKSRSKPDSGQIYFSSKDSITSPIVSPELEPEPVQEYHRESDSDQSPESFNEITGEFIKIPVKLSIKPFINAAVDKSLRSIGKPRNAPRPTNHARN